MIQLDKTLWKVERTTHRAAADLTQQWHYAKGGSRTAVYVYALYLKGGFRPYGISWWIPPIKGSVDKYNPGGMSSSLMLHRLVIVPGMATNAASFLLGRSIRLIKQDGRFDFLITYADTWRGHEGTIYKATNWEYQGESIPTPVWVTDDGQQLSRKYGGGGSYNHAGMKARGAALLGYFSKHVYTMKLNIQRKPVPVQLALAI